MEKTLARLLYKRITQELEDMKWEGWVCNHCGRFIEQDKAPGSPLDCPDCILLRSQGSKVYDFNVVLEEREKQKNV